MELLIHSRILPPAGGDQTYVVVVAALPADQRDAPDPQAQRIATAATLDEARRKCRELVKALQEAMCRRGVRVCTTGLE